MKIIIVYLLLISFYTPATELAHQELVNFTFEGETLNGVLNLPEDKPAKGIILIVHGYGKTNAVQQSWYADVRAIMLKAGYGTYMWDKMGCGQSTGSFDINQPVENSADEAIAAIKQLLSLKVSGAENIGLWGISRAGWINPLIIQKYPDIKFWISVSGVDGKENFKYLLEQNLVVDGYSSEKAKKVANEWLNGVQIAQAGGSYFDYSAATKNLSDNTFWQRFTDGGVSFFGYYLYKKDMQKIKLDEESGLPIYIPNFDSMLAKIDIPVLALFGELDKNVDWQKTQALYQESLDKDKLTVKSFPNCNHNLFKAKTGGYYEFEDDKLPWQRCDGFIQSIGQWLEQM